MPFQSEAQRRWMHATHPAMAREWDAHTPPGPLPEHVAKEQAAAPPVDHPTASRDRILAGDEYERIANVPVFDAHAEHDGAGNLVQAFGEVELQEICDRGNARAQQTGDLSPIGPGHTLKGVPETAQPPIWGYAAHYRVGRFGPGQKLGILCDWYVKKPYRGQLAEYPRRSVELWVKDKYIDRIALLKQTPKRDLGLMAYGKLYYQMDEPMDYPPHAAVPGAGMGAPPSPAAPVPPAPLPLAPPAFAPPVGPPPTAPPDAAAPDPEEMQRFARCMKHYMSQAFPHLGAMHQQFAAGLAPGGPSGGLPGAGPGFPSATSVAPPAFGAERERDPPESLYMKDPTEREADNVRFLRLETELQRYQKELHAERSLREQERQQQELAFQKRVEEFTKERETERLDYNREKSKRVVSTLQFEGYQLQDPAGLVEQMARMTEEDRIRKEHEIRTCYQKVNDPTLSPWVPVARGSADSYITAPATTPEQYSRAIALATADPKLGFDGALAQIKKGL